MIHMGDDIINKEIIFFMYQKDILEFVGKQEIKI